MYYLRIQSLDSPTAQATAVTDEVGTGGLGAATSGPLSPRSGHRPLTTTTSSSLTPLELRVETSAAPVRRPTIHHTRGIIHLYRSCPTTTSSAVAATSSSSTGPTAPQFFGASLLPPWRGTCLLILAVPTRFSPDVLLRYCDPHIQRACDIRFIRDDGVEGWYSVLVRFEDQNIADRFYLNFNGWLFTSQREVCHILFIASVLYTPSIEIASSPPVGSIELPTCPLCIERLGKDSSGIWPPTCDHSFRCSCGSMWLNSSCMVCQFCRKQSENSTCSVCRVTGNLWICVICGFVGCGWYKEGHARQHWKDTDHCYSLDLQTQRVWDYVGARYVHRLNEPGVTQSMQSSYSEDDCVNRS